MTDILVPTGRTRARRSTPKTREAVYDSKVSPLVQKLIELCDREGIPYALSFEVAPRTLVSSYNLGPDDSGRLRAAASILQHGVVGALERNMMDEPIPTPPEDFAPDPSAEDEDDEEDTYEGPDSPTPRTETAERMFLTTIDLKDTP